MNRDAAPLFVEERKYRRRRLGDAARLLPLGGAVLLTLPLLWTRGDGSLIARETLYLFLVWAGLILCTALLSRALAATPRAEGAPPAGDGPEPRARAASPDTRADPGGDTSDRPAASPRDNGPPS